MVALKQEGEVKREGCIRVSWLQGFHHEVSGYAQSRWGTPDVIFGPNAGASSHSSVLHPRLALACTRAASVLLTQKVIA